MSSVSSQTSLRCSARVWSAMACGRLSSGCVSGPAESTLASDSISVVLPVPRSPLRRMFRLHRVDSRYGPVRVAWTGRVSRSGAEGCAARDRSREQPDDAA